MLTKTDLRAKHAIMEDERAISYSMLSQSQEYRKAYEKYVPIINQYIETNKKKQISILNLGHGSGILENILLTEFTELHILSIDSSLTFNNICHNQNLNFINSGRLELRIWDIQNEMLFSQKYDIIFSRDLNHNINTPLNYFLNCINNALSDEGIFIIEDLRYDADMTGIYEFSDLISNIPAFKNDRWNFYHKILGLYESFAVSYTLQEIENILKKIKSILYVSCISSNRYHIIIYSDKKLKELVNKFCKKLV